MAATMDPRNPRIVPRNGVPQITSRYLEANSQSFKAGELVYFNSGAVTVAAVGDVPVAGIALTDATNVSTGNITIPVQLLGPDDEIYIRVSDGSGSYETANTTCVPGVAYDFNVASNLWSIDSADTTNPKLVFIEALYDATGTATQWARCKPYYLEAQVYAG
jgi:hypothetical protein